MREHFFEYFRPTEDEVKSLWAEAIFVFDTNVLLNLYRMSRETSKKMQQILVSLKGRLFLPNQVGIEFFKHAEEEIAKQVNAFELVKRNLQKIPGDFSKEFSRHPCIPIAEIAEALKECVNNQIDKVKQSQEGNQLNFLVHDDPILSELNSLFSGASEGRQASEEDDAVNQSVEDRVLKNLAPCFVPSGPKVPPENNPHRGDGRVWFQIVNYSRKAKKSIVFVTGDMKPNWWRTAKLGSEDRPIGPHFALIRDVADASTCKFWMYTQEQFLSMAPTYLGASEQTKAIEELRILQEALSLQAANDELGEPKTRMHKRLEESDGPAPDSEGALMEKDSDLAEEPKSVPQDEPKKGHGSEMEDEAR